MMLAARALLLSLVGTALACSSSNFDVSTGSSEDAGDDGQQTSETSGGDGDVDGAVDPCAADPSSAKFCVDVALESKSHPGYGGAAASSLGIDGKGIVYVALFDTDPAAATGTTSPTPKAVLQYPPPEKIGAEADVDKDLPLTLAGSAPPGKYWAIGYFADSKATRGSGSDAILPGDYVIVPPLDAMTKKVKWPTMTLSTGATARLDKPMKLRPVRRVDVALTETDSLRAQASANEMIHGDGPVMFALWDGSDLGGSATVVDAQYVKCVATKPKETNPPINVSFGTTVVDTHNITAILFDYNFDLKSGSNLLSPTKTGAAPAVATVSLGADQWTANTTVYLDKVIIPAPPATPDPLICPSTGG